MSLCARTHTHAHIQTALLPLHTLCFVIFWICLSQLFFFFFLIVSVEFVFLFVFDPPDHLLRTVLGMHYDKIHNCRLFLLIL